MGYLEALDRLDLNTTTFFYFVKDEIGVPVTLSMVEKAVARGELQPVRVGVRNRFSRRMGLEWVERIGVPIDWDRAKAEAKRAKAQRRLEAAEAELAELG